MNTDYLELLFNLFKSEDSLIKFNSYKTRDLLDLRKELYLFLKKLDNYLEIELTQNTNIIMPACPICGSRHIKKHGYLVKVLYCYNCKKTFKVNFKNNANKKTYCTHCNALYKDKYDFESSRRFKCLDCNKTFNNAGIFLGSRLHNDNIDKILRLILIIGNDNGYSIPQILAKLDIKKDTFYQWRTKILDVLPQLNNNFKRKST